MQTSHKMRTRIIKTVILTSGAKVMHLKQDNNPITRVQFCEPIAQSKSK